MPYDKSMSRPSIGDAASLAWLISFGDLLTLLVCFFLVLTPWSARHDESERAQYQHVTSQAAFAEKDGISLANRPLGQKFDLIAVIPIVKSKLLSAPEALGVEIVSRLESISGESGNEAGLMIVSLCDQQLRAEAFNVLHSISPERFHNGHAPQLELSHDCEGVTESGLGADKVVGNIRIVRE